MNGDESLQGVIETIDAAINYRLQLSQLLDGLHEAKSQVLSSAAQSRSKLRSHFECLRQCVVEALDERLSSLERAVDESERAAMEPLENNEQLLKARIDAAVKIMEEGKRLLVAEDEANHLPGDNDLMANFKHHLKDFDLDSLPEVPSLSETAFIHVDLPRDEENIQWQLVDAVREYGRVLTHAPIQIVDVSERPGAVYVKWAEVPQPNAADEPPMLDIEVYRLQYCLGVVHGTSCPPDDQFSDAYVGRGTSHVVRSLTPGQQYTFRVCGRNEGASSWSPWSAPVFWSTTLCRHEWRSSAPGYQLTKDDSTVCRDGQECTRDIVYSKLASYICGHSITFRVECIENCGSVNVDDGIGLTLCDSTDTTTSLLRSKGFLFYSFQGGVFVDGQEKTTRLPAATSGCSVIFETEVLSPDKVRVTIEVSDRIITFDWPVQRRPAPASSNSILMSFGPGCSKEDQGRINLFFAAHLSAPGWSVTVD